MKTLISLLLVVFMVIGLSGTFLVIKLNNFFVNYASANEFSPLDFIEEDDNFSVSVGYDSEMGRFYSYHYEFTE